MSRAELDYLVREFVLKVAGRLGLPSDFMSVEELRDQIKKCNSTISEHLESFISAYWEWFDFHRRVEVKQLAGQLTNDENQQLAKLVGRRNETRESLIHHLR